MDGVGGDDWKGRLRTGWATVYVAAAAILRQGCAPYGLAGGNPASVVLLLPGIKRCDACVRYRTDTPVRFRDALAQAGRAHSGQGSL